MVSGTPVSGKSAQVATPPGANRRVRREREPSSRHLHCASRKLPPKLNLGRHSAPIPLDRQVNTEGSRYLGSLREQQDIARVPESSQHQHRAQLSPVAPAGQLGCCAMPRCPNLSLICEKAWLPQEERELNGSAGNPSLLTRFTPNPGCGQILTRLVARPSAFGKTRPCILPE